MSLQADVGRWHRRRFPHEQAHNTVIKAFSELGEVADAVLGEDLGGKGDVAREAADVVIAMMSLVDKHTDDDLLLFVEEKLADLESR